MKWYFTTQAVRTSGKRDEHGNKASVALTPPDLKNYERNFSVRNMMKTLTNLTRSTTRTRVVFDLFFSADIVCDFFFSLHCVDKLTRILKNEIKKKRR